MFANIPEYSNFKNSHLLESEMLFISEGIEKPIQNFVYSIQTIQLLESRGYFTTEEYGFLSTYLNENGTHLNENLLDSFLKTIKDGSEKAQELGSAAVKKLQTAASNASNLAKMVGQAFVEIFNKVFKALMSKITKITASAKEKFADKKEDFKAILSKEMGDIKATVSYLTGGMLSKLQSSIKSGVADELEESLASNPDDIYQLLTTNIYESSSEATQSSGVIAKALKGVKFLWTIVEKVATNIVMYGMNKVSEVTALIGGPGPFEFVACPVIFSFILDEFVKMKLHVAPAALEKLIGTFFKFLAPHSNTIIILAEIALISYATYDVAKHITTKEH